MIGALAVDGWAVIFGTAIEEGPGRAAAPLSPLLAVPNNGPPINGQCRPTNFVSFDVAL